uniref:Uncharacterized protein n=1 Tax=Anguilla anguilla TaxID=7936 RepID=A0A0E9UD77_ANGAN
MFVSVTQFCVWDSALLLFLC